MHQAAECDVHRGNGSMLLVAPHGGRRPPVDPSDPPPNLRVNDVFTPEVTRLLAERLDAGWVINEEVDRNLLDLNRTSQVLRRAPWFLDLLVREIEAIVARHDHAEVLFVHGWNVGQTRCDLGVGVTEIDGVVHVSDGALMTVSESYRVTRLAALREGAARRGIEVSFGAHYAASHQNNLLQLFTAHDRHPSIPAVGQLCEWARAGVLDAVQLELGIPLRWPGRWRDNLLDVLTATFAQRPLIASHSQKAATPYARRPAPDESSATQSAALQFYDPAADLALLAGVGRIGPETLGGRLLLFLGGQRVALFTGEQPLAAQNGVPPLFLCDDGKRLRVELAGPILLLDDSSTYLDLEAAFVESHLAAARVALEFAAEDGGGGTVRFGTVRGEVEIDGSLRRISCSGFANVAALRAAGPGPATSLTATFESGPAFWSRAVDGNAEAVTWRFDTRGAETPSRSGLTAYVDADGFTPRRLEWQSHDGRVASGTPISRMAILRSGPGGYLRVSFGVARFDCEGREGWGIYEHAVPVGRRDGGSGR
ncbi:MAG: hypothetical protein HY270_15955 [Deltaproteobacteria bacterium]|nr:hypothetical protein [Deltaproteobacteria bacterium]